LLLGVVFEGALERVRVGAARDDEAIEAFGIGEGERPGDDCAEVVSDEMEPVGRGVVGDGSDVLDEALRSVRVAPVWSGRQVDTPGVGSDDMRPFRKHRELATPEVPELQGPMEKHDQGPPSRFRHVQP
jgi:hypothetical protein